jgi:hypothetical protein
MSYTHVKTLDTSRVQGEFKGERLACIEGWNGFQVVRIEGDPVAVRSLAHDADVHYRFVMDDDTLGHGIFKCLKARLYGIKDISDLVIPEVPEVSPRVPLAY